MMMVANGQSSPLTQKKIENHFCKFCEYGAEEEKHEIE